MRASTTTARPASVCPTTDATAKSAPPSQGHRTRVARARPGPKNKRVAWSPATTRMRWPSTAAAATPFSTRPTMRGVTAAAREPARRAENPRPRPTDRSEVRGLAPAPEKAIRSTFYCLGPKSRGRRG